MYKIVSGIIRSTLLFGLLSRLTGADAVWNPLGIQRPELHVLQPDWGWHHTLFIQNLFMY